jgi:putative RNA 2'-phosphotransferase
MTTKDISRYMSLVLRHKPETIDITLDANGWVAVDVLLEKMVISQSHLDKVFELQKRPKDKKRFELSEDGKMIRACQGHTVPVDLQLPTVTPPTTLYHGTATEHVASILSTGLNKGERHHVHMSQYPSTANEVGMRSGSAIIMQIDAYMMHLDGYEFFISNNGVYLTDSVPAKYISIKNRN